MDSNDWRPFVAVCALGLVAVSGTIAVCVFAWSGREPTAAFAALVSSAITALGGELGDRAARSRMRNMVKHEVND